MESEIPIYILNPVIVVYYFLLFITKLIFSKIVLAEIGHELSHPTLFFKLFIYFWLRWVCIAVQGLSPVVVSRGCSLLSA